MTDKTPQEKMRLVQQYGAGLAKQLINIIVKEGPPVDFVHADEQEITRMAVLSYACQVILEIAEKAAENIMADLTPTERTEFNKNLRELFPDSGEPTDEEKKEWN